MFVQRASLGFVKRTAEDAALTRGRLVAAGRRLFATVGFTAVPVEAIVSEAGVTRGALYHHFRDKSDLFEAVYQEVNEALDAQVSAAGWRAAEETGELWPAFWAGTDTYLDLCVDPMVGRIALLEAPIALGWNRWAELDAQYGPAQFRGFMELLIAAGEVEEQPLDPLTHVLNGAYNEAGRRIVNAQDPAAAQDVYAMSLRHLVTGIIAKR